MCILGRQLSDFRFAIVHFRLPKQELYIQARAHVKGEIENPKSKIEEYLREDPVCPTKRYRSISSN